MREELLNELEAEYAARRAENEREEMLRAAEIRDKYPEIQRLKDRRQELVRSGIRRIGSGAAADTTVPMSEQMETLNREIRAGLKAAGLPEDYLSPVYRCPLCHDTGYTGEPIRERCSCMKEAYRQKLSKKIGLAGGKAETFETFDLSIIPDVPEEGQRFTQRQLSGGIRDLCEEWADRYPNGKRHTIVLSGKSGLGKTFLMHAMAQRLAERGFNVLMISAFQFLQTARKSFFENDEGMDELIDAPILMLDDVGSEPLMKNITIEALFNLINERQNRGLSTVLSTNLTMEEFRERYSERIASRITDSRTCELFVLRGKDLRKVGGVQK